MGSGGPTVPVVVAAQALARGVVLQPSYLKIVNYPQEAAPTNAFHSIAELAGSKDSSAWPCARWWRTSRSWSAMSAARAAN